MTLQRLPILIFLVLVLSVTATPASEDFLSPLRAKPAVTSIDGDHEETMLEVKFAHGSKSFSLRTGLEVYDVLPVIGNLAFLKDGCKAIKTNRGDLRGLFQRFYVCRLVNVN